jgi:hypothetical protein
MGDLLKFLTDISSIYWWISVIVVGLIVNIGGEYLVRIIDKEASSFIKSYREKSIIKKNKKTEQDKAIIEALTNCPKYFLYYQTRTENINLFGFICSAIALVLVLFAVTIEPISSNNFVILFFSALLVFLGTAFRRRYHDRQKLIFQVTDNEIKEKGITLS